MYRGGLDRFKKSQSLEPFSVSASSAAKNGSASKAANSLVQSFQTQNSSLNHIQHQHQVAPMSVGSEAATPVPHTTQIGGGQSTWQPPDWAIEPRPRVFFLDVIKDGEVIDQINLEKKKHIFGRQIQTCDFVLDHQSVSRQHAAVVPHRNGSIYVIDLGSVHGTFVANERLTKDNPVELEVGQSLRFAASTRSYILRKNTAALFPTPALPTGVDLPSPPDPSDEDAVVAYNTILNRYGISKSDLSNLKRHSEGVSSDVETEPGPIGRRWKDKRKNLVSVNMWVLGRQINMACISDKIRIIDEPDPIKIQKGALVQWDEILHRIAVSSYGPDDSSGKRIKLLVSMEVVVRLDHFINAFVNTDKYLHFDTKYDGRAKMEKNRKREYSVLEDVGYLVNSCYSLKGYCDSLIMLSRDYTPVGSLADRGSLWGTVPHMPIPHMLDRC
ncbi:hypothetical protein ZIOFF_019965 [Zingiber officinale]|uniref:FHA domain-containing protein n=1 Tax=Zingiber officinale TaxID=94328 RepID=A0A8J5LTH7_ZINOF|nr:hypothetical protein ZIOFF_019965 [Zingiber officinale]